MFASLLSIPLLAEHVQVPPNPQHHKDQTLTALLSWLQRSATHQPVRLEIEDIHWADPSTLELLGLLIDAVPSCAILVLLTFRPEFIPPWPNQAHMLPLQLSRLPQQHITDMVERVAGKALPADILQQLITTSDGVPLYIEEMTKNLLESGVLHEHDGHYVVNDPLPPLAIPASLQDSLAARLDRLAPVRELAQIGAVLGREFLYALLKSVAQLEDRRLQDGLHQLETAEILYRRGVPPHATYLFKHALVQEAAYQSTLKSQRQHWHRLTALALEAAFSETRELHPELLAHHFTEAHLCEQAVPYWQQAGQRAIDRSAYPEAIRHLRMGLDCVQHLPDTPVRAEQELALLVALGVPLIATKGYGVAEVETLYSRAHSLVEQVGETPQLLPVLHGLRVFYLIRGILPTALEMAQRILRLAEQSTDQAALQVAHGVVAETHFHLAHRKETEHFLTEGIRLYVPAQHRTSGFLWLDTARVYSKNRSIG